MKSFLMIGQSNMAGRGDFDEVPAIHNEKAFMLRNGRWHPMSEPINPDRSVFPIGPLKIHSGVGLAASFADEYARKFDEEIGLIPCADGGTRLCQWMPGEILYEHAVMQAQFAMRSSELVGILWHQGESDSFSRENVSLYYDNFMIMINRLKAELGVPDIPVIIGELGEFVCNYQDGKYRYSEELNEVLRRIADDLPRCGIVSANGLKCRLDNIHFNSSSYREFGKRYFEMYCKIK